MFREKNYPKNSIFYTDNICAAVTNFMSGFTCHMSHVSCHVSHVIFYMFLYSFFTFKVVQLVGVWSVINGATPSSLYIFTQKIYIVCFF